MDLEVLKFWSQFGAMGLCTAVVLWIYTKQTAKHEDNWRQITTRIVDDFREMHDDNKTLIKECTAAFSQCTSVLTQMSRQIDRWDGQERRSPRRISGSG